MVELTDDTIEIICAECVGPYHIEEGLQSMIAHIRSAHKNYSEMEASEHALRWMEDVYNAEDLREERATKAQHGRKVG